MIKSLIAWFKAGMEHAHNRRVIREMRKTNLAVEILRSYCK